MLSINVTSYRYLIDGTGDNPNESVLTPANVKSTADGGTFGKQFSVSVDGQVLAQPLYMAGLTMTATPNGSQNVLSPVPTNLANTVHNVVFVATENDSVYAIDATNGQVLWQDAFINGTTITTVPSGDVNSGDISPQIGITGTPAIDPSTNFLYVVVETKESETAQLASQTSTPHYLAILEKIDIQNGTDTSVVIADTTDASGAYTYNSGPFVYGTGAGAITVDGQSVVYFNALRQMFRPGILLYDGQVILGSASHGDNGPYHGWMLTYNESTLALTGVLNTTPNGGLGGIWQGDGAIVVDPQGCFYFETGNGDFNQNPSNFSPSYTSDGDELPLDADYGDSFVKVGIDSSTTQSDQGPNGWGLTVVDYFTPQDQQQLSNSDEDLGSGGPIILPTSAGSSELPDLMLGGGKEGEIYLLNRNHMGGFSTTDAGVVEELAGAVGGILSDPAYFNGDIYYTGGYSGGITEFAISNGVINPTPVSTTPDGFANLDGGPVVTSDGSVNGIVWALDRGTGQLRAYSASNLNDELYTSAQAANGADAIVGGVMKYTTPMIANGQVFVGTGDALMMYSLPTQPTEPPTAPENLTATAPAATDVALSWTDVAFDAAAYDIERSTDDVNFTQIGQAAADSTSYEDTTAQPITTYYYRVRASNSVGYSAYTDVATITTAGEQTVGTGDGLLGQYYSGTNVNFSTATPAFTRVDPEIDFNWNGTGPGGGLGATDYSVQWTGEVQAQYSQAYTFYTTSSDGIRVIINGQTVINDYNNHGPTVDASTSINFTAGESATIVVQYYEATDAAQAVLEWSSASTPEEVIPQSQLFSGTAPAAPVLATPVAASGTQINLSWTESSNFADGFEIDRKTGANGTFSVLAIVNPSVTTYMDTSLTEDTTYYYQVRALNFEADSAYSNEESLTTPTPPPTPSDATPTTITTTSIAFSWFNNATDGTQTHILRLATLAGGDFAFVAALPSVYGPASYVDNGPNGAGLTPGTEYDYHIQVGNAAGYSDFTGFTVQTLTTAPTELVAVGGNGQVTLAWNAPYGALSFNVYRSTTSGGEGATPIATGISGDSYIDTGLTNGQTYYYEVTAVDTGGESATSSEASAAPQVPTAKSSPPTDVTATAGDTTDTLQWIAAEGAASYNIYRGTVSGHETLLQSGISTPSFADSGLTDGTTYYYYVTSVNSFGEGTSSAEVSVTPHPLAPRTPVGVTATGGNSQVELSWTAASDASSYNIYRATDSGDEVLYQQGIIGTSFDDTGVTNGVTYYYQVSAANGVGESDLSLEVTATPLPPLPTAPTSLAASALNDTQIKLTWQGASSSLTGFEVFRSTDDVNFSLLTTLDPTATSYVDSYDLTAGTTYYYQVVAMNLAGNSSASNTAHTAVTTAIPPGWTDADIGGPEYAGSASYNSGVMTVSGGGADIWYSADQFNYVYQSLNGNGTIIAQVLTQGDTNPWAMAGVMIRNLVTNSGSTFADMVLTPGNGAAFQYRATADTSNLGNDQTGGTAPDWVEITRSGNTITGYISSNGTSWTEVGSYTFAAGTMGTHVYIGLAVTAFNNKLISTATFGNLSITGQAVPATPTNLAANPVSGASALLQWQDADASIYTYNVYRENPGATSYTLIGTVPGNVTSFTDTGLTSGDSYSYEVVATNTVGVSSAANTSVILPILPQAPTLAEPNSIAATSAGLSWVLNSSNDTSVNVYQRTGNATTFTLIATLATGSTTYELAGLQPGTVYEYQVSAVNLAGESSFADTGFTTLPAAPADLTATAGSAKITLQWQPVTGALIYNVFRGLSAGGEGANPYASGLTNTTFVDNGVNPGTTYYYTVVAADFTGQGAASNQVHASVVDPLVVTSTDDSGAGSLRQAILNADALPAATQTITFALPAGSQTIDLLSPLPASSVSIVAQLDAAQNVTIESASQGIADSESVSQAVLGSASTLTTTGAGSLTIAGGIDGTGNLVVGAGGSLTVNSVVQNTLTIGAGATLTIAPSGPPATDSTAVSAVDTTSTAAGSALEQAAAARRAAVQAERLAAQLAASSASTTDAGASLTAVAPPVATSTTATTSFATPVIQPATAPLVTPVENDAPAVAATSIVVSTNAPTATLTVSLPPTISQPAAPAAAIATAPAFVSAPLAIQTATPKPTLDSPTPGLSRLELEAAIPLSFQFMTGQSVDQISTAPGASALAGAKDQLNGSDTAAVFPSSLIVPLGTGAEEFLNGQNSAGATDASGFHEAIDAIFADGDNAASRVDDALLNLLADEAWNRK
jgi:fibronectin type 3 domain-containing protein